MGLLTVISTLLLNVRTGKSEKRIRTHKCFRFLFLEESGYIILSNVSVTGSNGMVRIFNFEGREQRIYETESLIFGHGRNSRVGSKEMFT